MSRILVTDDDIVQLDLYKQLLEVAGYQVEIAVSASQTVRHIAKADLLVMDLRMPNALGESDSGEGMALIRRIRDLGYRAPVIVLSGWPEDLYGQPEEQLVSCILVKPVGTRELLQTIHDLLAAAT
jgi:CheY-like chemotaxis protein